jgi:hypothetical protein
MKTKEEILYNNGVYLTDLISSSTMGGIEAAMDEYANQDKWISVKNELPEKGERVLVFTDYGGFDVCYLNNNNSWINSMRPQHSNGNVTHWQPLPDTPNND